VVAARMEGHLIARSGGWSMFANSAAVRDEHTSGERAKMTAPDPEPSHPCRRARSTAKIALLPIRGRPPARSASEQPVPVIKFVLRSGK